MTGKPFRFRYASEIAGTFVLLSVAMLVAGILLAGRTQGWFERDFTLKTRFDTEEGAFGLQEGNEVRIRNTLAGRVGKIMPMADGSLQASFTLKNRFKPFLTRGAAAKIRKKFGVAGDSFVDLEAGKGGPIQDGDVIDCKKDEEIMETARKMLTDRQTDFSPSATCQTAVMRTPSFSALSAGWEAGIGVSAADSDATGVASAFLSAFG